MVLLRNVTDVTSEILIEEMAKNPLTAFHVIRRMTMDVDKVVPPLLKMNSKLYEI